MAQQIKIIGRGTWLDKVASEVVEREKSLRRDIALIRVESGLAASGIPHVGSVGDAIRSYGVKLALEGLGYRSELIAFSDDLDGLRRVPQGFPSWLNDYVAQPVTRVPDAFGCHKSFGEHSSSLLRESLDKLGVEYNFRSGAETYKSGILNDQIRKILSNSDAIGKMIKEITGQEKYEQILPYTPICKKCGRLYTTVVTHFDAQNETVRYECRGTELRDKRVEGCGFQGERRISEGEGKLAWKSEFAARWAALDIRFEAYGKDIADSVKVNDWVCEKILGFPPPHHVRYELFQDKSGKKIAKSVGNVLTPQEWLRYASPESLRLLMFKRIVGARSVSIDDIPLYMNEFDELEDYYFSLRRDPNAMKDAKTRGLYEYSVLTKVPEKPGLHVPYRLLTQLAPVAPAERLEEFVTKRLIAYKMIKEGSTEVNARIRWAHDWSHATKVTRTAAIKIDPKLEDAIREFASSLKGCKTSDDVQAAAFTSLRKYGLDTNRFFAALYQILIGSDKGPRLGPYIMDIGTDEVASILLNGLTDRS
ncbi:MAG: lysine--tRNA ligase [Thaumarchaeota archaeon]|nr:lysine--tRNA ligase [Nitrososphaerota archaeon]